MKKLRDLLYKVRGGAVKVIYPKYSKDSNESCNFDVFYRQGSNENFFGDAKGQIISECPYEKIVCPKIATKKFLRFLSWPLRRGQIKNFIKPIMLNNP